MEIKLRFRLDPSEIKTWPEKDYEAIERAQDGEARLYLLRPIMAKHMIDRDDKPIHPSAALRLLGEIPLEDWPGVIQSFIEGVRDAAIPNAKGSLSNSLSEAGTTAPRQDGVLP